MKAGILIGHLRNKGNEGAIIRTAEAFGLSHVFVIGKKENSYFSSEGTEKHVTFLEFKNLNEIIRYAKKNNHKIVCIENINKAKELDEVKKYPVNPIFVTGHEGLGVPKDLVKSASLVVKIPQGLGYANCLNTGTAMGIVINDFFNKEFKCKQKLWEESTHKKIKKC